MSTERKNIVLKGGREHNLQNIDLSIPRDKFVVVTGLSGSGKSTLAFDTIYAEGQRRYVESLSAYARQFLGQMKKPEVDYIEGLSPAISIDQKTTKVNPRSTVGTITEIYDYLRLLFARIGIPHCPNCGKEISHQTIGQITESIIEEGEGTKIHVLAPVVKDRKGEHKDILEDFRKKGFVRVRVDGEIKGLDEDIELGKNFRHSIELSKILAGLVIPIYSFIIRQCFPDPVLFHNGRDENLFAVLIKGHGPDRHQVAVLITQIRVAVIEIDIASTILADFVFLFGSDIHLGKVFFFFGHFPLQGTVSAEHGR